MFVCYIADAADNNDGDDDAGEDDVQVGYLVS